MAKGHFGGFMWPNEKHWESLLWYMLQKSSFSHQ